MRAASVFILHFLFLQIAFSQSVINTYAGNGQTGFAGDLAQAKLSKLWHPEGIVMDTSGALYIADVTNNRIRKIAYSTGIITTVCGNGTFAYTGDAGLAKFAGLNSPEGIAIDSAGNLYIADTNNDCIRKIASGTGIISTIAGGGTQGLGDGFSARKAKLNNPTAVVVDAKGNLFIADWGNNRIRKVSSTDSTISTIAGNGTAGYGGDNGLASASQLNSPFGLALDASGTLYFSDAGNNRVRKIAAGSGIITTVIGKLNNPTGIAVGDSGMLYIADQGNNRILKVKTTDGSSTIFAGKGGDGDYSGDGEDPLNADLWAPTGIAVDRNGILYFSDRNNNRIRKVGKVN